MHIMDLETRMDQLISDNRSLQEARFQAERNIEDAQQERAMHATAIRQATEAVESRDHIIHQKDGEIMQIQGMLEALKTELARLSAENEHISTSHRELSSGADERYVDLEAKSAHAHEQWQASSRALEDLQQQHTTTVASMEGNMRREIANAVEDRNAEIRRLQRELAEAKQQIKTLQQDILASKQGETFLSIRDEDWFDSACQQLCHHVQQWVHRFSKFSDGKPCKLSSEITDEGIEARLDNAILDGSDVDMLLADRVRRRDVFMSVVMNMIFEYVFTRYLFGMDQEQRQKLKKLEKQLSDIGPPRAVAQWRAITLTLLSKRESFMSQRARDTEGVAYEIYRTLATLLEPPSRYQSQSQESLKNVIKLAADLSIEMRTQRAEYIMLPPLVPEYDTNGDLTQKVQFNASLMNERSGETSSNEELEARGAVVKIVLFPLVVKKGDEQGEGDDEIVVCPAQVLVARPSANKKVVRVMSGAMDMDERRSMRSVPESAMDLGSGI
ncbi:hypothetical protein K402DRAFT_414345 [Aulographum hederae CBS 113979]|uniref:Involucrin repeat protein n=1 Tax=Aulographum hederae CBS 113979 TaxID=1176131 RepID=A0A6G1GRQ6_9PEZI|nr:hypothetical protein K402DRAFT_414345 [Aulographum hederae CBS 113979]